MRYEEFDYLDSTNFGKSVPGPVEHSSAANRLGCSRYYFCEYLALGTFKVGLQPLQLRTAAADVTFM